MDISHFSLSSMPKEKFDEFLYRLANSIRELGDSTNIYNLHISSPEESVDENQYVASVYFKYSVGSDYSARSQTIYSIAVDNSIEAVLDINKKLTEWLNKNKHEAIIDIQHDIFVDQNGKNIAKVQIFY